MAIRSLLLCGRRIRYFLRTGDEGKDARRDTKRLYEEVAPTLSRLNSTYYFNMLNLTHILPTDRYMIHIPP